MSYHCSLSQFQTPSTEAAGHGAPAWLLARLKAEQDRLFCSQPYRSIHDFATTYRLVLPGKLTWRLCHRQVGHIHGLDNSYGHLTATNGVLAYIEQGGGTLFLGHLENWVQFKDEDSQEEQQPTTTKTSQKLKAFVEFDL